MLVGKGRKEEAIDVPKKQLNYKPGSKIEAGFSVQYETKFGLQTGVGKKFPLVSFDEFVARATEKGNGFIFSKNMCLMFISTFLESKQEIRNDISPEIVR